MPQNEKRSGERCVLPTPARARAVRWGGEAGGCSLGGADANASGVSISLVAARLVRLSEALYRLPQWQVNK